MSMTRSQRTSTGFRPQIFTGAIHQSTHFPNLDPINLHRHIISLPARQPPIPRIPEITRGTRRGIRPRFTISRTIREIRRCSADRYVHDEVEGVIKWCLRPKEVSKASRDDKGQTDRLTVGHSYLQGFDKLLGNPPFSQKLSLPSGTSKTTFFGSST